MNKFLILFITAGLWLATAGAQNIYTRAGTSNPGDFQAATSAQVYPTDICLDANGNIFIADQLYNRIRKINAADGKITTIAGTGTYGNNGDGILATSAQLKAPRGMAIDARGNIYIAELLNHCIRMVSAVDGKISTVAGNGTAGYSGDGGAATASQLNFPYDVAIDASGNLFIADGNNYCVRKVNAADGKISTVAGNGTPGFSGDGSLATAAQLSVINSIAIDVNGNLYLSDTYNYRIRKVNAADGKINTLTGNGTVGYTGEGGQALAATIATPGCITVDANGNVFFSDNNDDSYVYGFRKISSTDGTIHTVAGNGTPGFAGDGGPAVAARLQSPFSVAVDKTGNLFLGDAGNERIRKVNAADQLISTIAGVGTNNTSGPRMPAGDGGGATQARLNIPGNIGTDDNGNIYIADMGNNCIRKINAIDGIIHTVAGNAVGFSGDGGIATAAGIDFSCMATDKNGNIYIGGANRIRRINAADGKINTIAGNGTSVYAGDGGAAAAATLSGISTLATDSKGNIYVADNYRIRKINATDGIINTIAGIGVSYRGTAANGDGAAATLAKITTVTGMAIDASGNIYFSESNSRIRKINATDGIIQTVIGTGSAGYTGDNGPAASAKLSGPGSLAIDASGNIFIADANNYRIRKVNAADGIITTVAGNGTSGYSGDGAPATLAQLSSPAGIAINNNGILFISDNGNNRIRYVCTGSGLASAATNDTRTAYPADTTATVFFNNNCAFICNLAPAGEHPVAGNITGKVWIENGVTIAHNQPYVQRHYEVMPELNAAAATARVDLYVTQAELDAYNAAALVAGGIYYPLPVNAADTASNKAHLRILYASGASSNTTGLPDTYNGDTTFITPAAIVWDAANNWWKISIDATGFGGFFVTSVKVPPPPVPVADNLFVPNMFSPNGDGKNDLLLVYGNHLSSVRILIFNQWGQKVFETRNGQQDGWDGRSGGKSLPVGVYMYVLEARLEDGTVLKRKGSISLIR